MTCSTSRRRVMIVAAAFLAALVLFYGLDHLVMSMQGLPLDLTLSPAH